MAAGAAREAVPSAPLTTLLVSYNTRDLLDPCLQALRAASPGGQPHPVIVVDNASRDGSAEHLARHHPEVQLLRSERNVGFGRANNLALDQVRTPWLLLLNTDAFVAPEAIEASLDYLAAHPRVGILGGRLVGRDGVLQPSCRYFPTPWNLFVARAGLARWLPSRPVDDMSWDHAQPRLCDWVPGCFYLVRRELLQQIGLFDPRFFLYYEEVDHCRRAREAGWEVAYFPGARVVHIGGESAKSDATLQQASRQIDVLNIESALLYFRKHQGLPGVLGYLLLDLLADAVLSLKALLRGRGAAAVQPWRRMAGSLRAARATHLGANPVR